VHVNIARISHLVTIQVRVFPMTRDSDTALHFLRRSELVHVLPQSGSLERILDIARLPKDPPLAAQCQDIDCAENGQWAGSVLGNIARVCSRVLTWC